MKLNYFLLFAILLLTQNCNRLDKKLIRGEWEVAQINEDKRPLEIDPSQVKFLFEEKKYFFESTLNYKEQGTYKVKNNFVMAEAQIPEAEEKKIQIIKLTKDSLHLRMQHDGKDRLMKMFRKYK